MPNVMKSAVFSLIEAFLIVKKAIESLEKNGKILLLDSINNIFISFFL
jgi:hypothetical protein